MMHTDRSRLGQDTVSYEGLLKTLVAKYGRPDSDFALRDSLSTLEHCFPDPQSLKGLKILDLGCGAVAGSGEVDSNQGTWGPRLLRAAKELGATCVGIDIGTVGPKDNFEFHQLDLSQPRALDFLASNQFDAVNCTNLFSSPHLVYRMGLRAPEKRAPIMLDLKQQVERLLKKPGGRVICFDESLDNH